MARFDRSERPLTAGERRSCDVLTVMLAQAERHILQLPPSAERSLSVRRLQEAMAWYREALLLPPRA